MAVWSPLLASGYLTISRHGLGEATLARAPKVAETIISWTTLWWVLTRAAVRQLKLNLTHSNADLQHRRVLDAAAGREGHQRPSVLVVERERLIEHDYVAGQRLPRLLTAGVDRRGSPARSGPAIIREFLDEPVESVPSSFGALGLAEFSCPEGSHRDLDPGEAVHCSRAFCSARLRGHYSLLVVQRLRLVSRAPRSLHYHRTVPPGRPQASQYRKPTGHWAVRRFIAEACTGRSRGADRHGCPGRLPAMDGEVAMVWAGLVRLRCRPWRGCSGELSASGM